MPMSSCYGLLVAWQATLEALCMCEVLEDRRGYMRTYVCVSAYWCVCVCREVYVCIYVHTHVRMCASVYTCALVW